MSERTASKNHIKSKAFTLALAITALVGTGGCLTSAMWSSNDISKRVKVQKMIANDKVIAFGQAKVESQQLEKGSLIMMGQRYWYAMPADVSEQFVSMLKTGLPRAYTITTPRQDSNSIINASNNTVPIEISDNVGQFSSQFCLNYILDSNPSIAQQEIAKLTSVDFIEVDSNKHNYQKCIDTEGKYFTAINDNVSAEYQFVNPINVSMYTYQSTTKTNIGNAVTNIVATPFTLAADTVLTVVLLPFLLLGGAS